MNCFGRLRWGLSLMECPLLRLCFDGDIDGSLELVPGVILPLQILKPSVMFSENLQSDQSFRGITVRKKIGLPCLLRVVEILNRVGNEIGIGNLVMLKDEIVPLHDELSCQLMLAFVGIGTAAGSEKQDVSSTFWMGPCSRRSGQRC